ncbi:MAG TPA: deacetylase [Burkholderiales bacterium]|nr:deacetylase [Burkholderiales bacterium]
MSDTPLVITIDTEGDDLWARPREITTRNAEYLPRFQALCERFRFKPVYLTNYEMAMSDAFVEFARDVVARGAGEVGMHLHAWNSPPLVPLTSDDFHHQPYLIEYPDAVMKEKIKVVTRLLEDRFDQAMLSHRAGRLGFDGRYAAMLLDEGYRVDCSVSPGLDWSGTPGDPRGNGGTDYTRFRHDPYFLSPSDISAPASAGLLEVPMTIRSSGLFRRAPWVYRIPLLRQTANRLVSPALNHLCPAENGLGGLLRAARAARADGAAHTEFTLHSSEFMPGGSPTFRNGSDIERLYEDLEILFGELSTWCRGMTLKEFHARFSESVRPAASGNPEDSLEMARA